MKVVELKLTEGLNGEGITAISLVKNPAIEQTWIAFSEGGEAAAKEFKPNPAFKFKTIDEEQRIVVGPAMIPDKMIYRRDEDGEEFFVYFTEATIRGLAERFLLQGKQNNMTLEHQATLNDLSVVESWIVEDSEKDKSAMYGFNLPKGTWFVAVKVLNDEVWKLVKANDVSGFSVEGVFTNQIIKQNEIMSTKNSKLDSYLDKIRGLFTTETVEETTETTPEETEKFGTVEAEGPNGTLIISFPGEVLEVGAAITTTVDETEAPVPTGEYVLSDGTVLIVAEDGVVGELQPAETTEEPENPEEMEAESDGLKAEQIDKLVDGIAEILATFKGEFKAETEAANKTAIDKAVAVLRVEFNKEAEPEKPETPENTDKAKIVRGLSKFIREEKK